MKPGLLFCLLGSLLLQLSGNTEAVSRQYRVLVHIASAHHTEHLDLTCHNNFDTSTPFAEFTEIVTQETVTNNGKDKVKVVVSQKNYQHRAASTDEPGPSQKNTPGVGTTTTTKGPANKSPLITLTTTKRPAKPAATTSKAPAATTKKLPAATAKPLTADTKQKQMFTTTTRKPARPIKTFTTTTKKLPAATAAAATTKVADKSAILTTKAPAKPAAASTPKSPAKPAAASTTKIPAKPAAASTTKIPANPAAATTPASLVTKKAIPVKPKSISLPPLKPNSVTKKPGQAATKKPPMVPISMKPSIVTQKPKEMLTTTTKKAAPPTTLQPEKIAVNRFTMSVDVAGLRDLRERAMNDDDDYE